MDTYQSREEALDAVRADLGKLLASESVTVVAPGCPCCAGLAAVPSPHTVEVYEDLAGEPGDVIRVWVHEQPV